MMDNIIENLKNDWKKSQDLMKACQYNIRYMREEITFWEEKKKILKEYDNKLLLIENLKDENKNIEKWLTVKKKYQIYDIYREKRKLLEDNQNQILSLMSVEYNNNLLLFIGDIVKCIRDRKENYDVLKSDGFNQFFESINDKNISSDRLDNIIMLLKSIIIGTEHTFDMYVYGSNYKVDAINFFKKFKDWYDVMWKNENVCDIRSLDFSDMDTADIIEMLANIYNDWAYNECKKSGVRLRFSHCDGHAGKLSHKCMITINNKLKCDCASDEFMYDNMTERSQKFKNIAVIYDYEVMKKFVENHEKLPTGISIGQSIMHQENHIFLGILNCETHSHCGSSCWRSEDKKCLKS